MSPRRAAPFSRRRRNGWPSRRLSVRIIFSWRVGGHRSDRADPRLSTTGPLLILHTLITDFAILLPNLIVTLRTTLLAFLAAAFGGLLLGLLFTFSRWVERTLFPYAVILQVTPIVAIAPLIIIWVNNTQIALLICAWIVAFFQSCPTLQSAQQHRSQPYRSLPSLRRVKSKRSFC